MIIAIQNKIQLQINKINGSLRAFSLKLTGGMDDAEDLYQDTVVRIITNAEKFNEGTNFKAWAITIMRNIFINNYRKKMRRNLIIDQTPNNYYLNSGVVTIKNGGEENMGYKELMKMVDVLHDDFRVPFMMAYQGFKYDEIAEKLGITVSTSKSNLTRARAKLQNLVTAKINN